MSKNDDEVQQLRQQLVDAQTEQEIQLIDKKLGVLKKYQ